MQNKNDTINNRRYRTVGIVVFVISLCLVAVRLSFYVLSSKGVVLEKTPWINDLIFSLFVQVIILFLFVFIFYRFKFGMNKAQVFEFSNIHSVNKKNVLLSIALGFCVTVVSSGISVIWNIILSFFGYSALGGGDYMPPQFDIWLFVMYFICSAVLPAFCEEFALRGGLLSVMKEKYNKKTLIIIMGLAFGLFHGYIAQFGYTALIGALLCWLTITTGSLICAMIVHFINNALAVIVSYAINYKWFDGNVIGSVIEVFLNSFWVTILLYICVCIGLIFVIKAIEKFNKDNNNKFFVSFKNYPKIKVSFEDNIFYIGAIVVTALATLSTFIWGLY